MFSHILVECSVVRETSISRYHGGKFMALQKPLEYHSDMVSRGPRVSISRGSWGSLSRNSVSRGSVSRLFNII